MSEEEKAKEIARLEAISRANEVFDALTRIGHLRSFIQAKMVMHDAQVERNSKRDCASFHERISELGLRNEIEREFL